MSYALSSSKERVVIRHNDKTVTFSEAEFRSLKRLIAACRTAIGNLPSDGDFLGWDNYTALDMWDDKLKGRKYDLADYVDVDPEETATETHASLPTPTPAPQTVDAWLVEYGRKKSRCL